MPSRRRHPGHERKGAAAVELAVLLPLLAFLVAVGCDYARILYYAQIITNASRNGAVYQSDTFAQQDSPYKNVTEAALADTSNLNDPGNKPTVSTGTGTDSTGQGYVEVSVSYTFKTLTGVPGVPKVVNLTRTTRMAIAPTGPT